MTTHQNAALVKKRQRKGKSISGVFFELLPSGRDVALSLQEKAAATAPSLGVNACQFSILCSLQPSVKCMYVCMYCSHGSAPARAAFFRHAEEVRRYLCSCGLPRRRRGTTRVPPNVRHAAGGIGSVLF